MKSAADIVAGIPLPSQEDLAAGGATTRVARAADDAEQAQANAEALKANNAVAARVVVRPANLPAYNPHVAPEDRKIVRPTQVLVDGQVLPIHKPDAVPSAREVIHHKAAAVVDGQVLPVHNPDAVPSAKEVIRPTAKVDGVDYQIYGDMPSAKDLIHAAAPKTVAVVDGQVLPVHNPDAVPSASDVIHPKAVAVVDGVTLPVHNPDAIPSAQEIIHPATGIDDPNLGEDFVKTLLQKQEAMSKAPSAAAEPSIEGVLAANAANRAQKEASGHIEPYVAPEKELGEIEGALANKKSSLNEDFLPSPARINLAESLSRATVASNKRFAAVGMSKEQFDANIQGLSPSPFQRQILNATITCVFSGQQPIVSGLPNGLHLSGKPAGENCDVWVQRHGEKEIEISILKNGVNMDVSGCAAITTMSPNAITSEIHQNQNGNLQDPDPHTSAIRKFDEGGTCVFAASYENGHAAEHAEVPHVQLKQVKVQEIEQKTGGMRR